jgi:hypothetical protein
MYSTQQSGEETWEALKGEVQRLGQLDGYPVPEFQPKAFVELVIALQNADSLQEAKQFIDDVMMCELICPKPSQLRDMIRSARESREAAEPDREVDAWKRLQELPSDMTPSEKQNLEAHMTILLARMKETKGMTWPQRQRSTPLKDALQIANRQLLEGSRVTGAY